MKRMLLILCVGVSAIAQTPIRHGDLVITADYQQSSGNMRQLSGHVVMETDSMLLRADKVDFNEDTREIVAHGDVQVKLK
jgi:lipopolysaccharide assembly outer membrane protein LptD (OstA)